MDHKKINNGHTPRSKDICSDCHLRRNDLFCQLPPADRLGLDQIKTTKSYPKGARLFVEGQPADGVYMLCQGKVKLSACSKDGKVLILGISDAGDVLGLSAAVNGQEYETTAEVIGACQVNYIKTADLVKFLKKHPEACFNAARQLSRDYQTAYRQICSLGLSGSVIDKLAKLFLGWSGKETGNGNGNGNGSDKIHIHLTHEEIAAKIGASRETVTRTLKYFREQGLISIKRSHLVVLDRKGLSALIGSRRGVPHDM